MRELERREERRVRRLLLACGRDGEYVRVRSAVV
jgi:hypothetical protein